MHPTTINDISPQQFATLLTYEKPITQAAFLYSLAKDLEKQAKGDARKGYWKIVNDMTNALPHLERAARHITTETIDDYVERTVAPIARDVGALRYDAMIDFLKTYAALTHEQPLLDAAYCVQDAWKHTPTSWKKIYAPETLI